MEILIFTLFLFILCISYNRDYQINYLKINIPNKNHDTNVMSYFDYMPYSTYEERLNDLKKRNFDRKGLVNVLKHLNSDWNAPIETMQNIERLKDDKSVVVIGGQQAGLLTGPMY